MIRRYLEDRKTRKRVKEWLAKHPGYLNRNQQIELGLVPKWDLPWSRHFLWWGIDDRVRAPQVMYIERPKPKVEPHEAKQTVHPALDALRNTGGKPMGLKVEEPVVVPQFRDSSVG